MKNLLTLTAQLTEKLKKLSSLTSAVYTYTPHSGTLYGEIEFPYTKDCQQDIENVVAARVSEKDLPYAWELQMTELSCQLGEIGVATFELKMLQTT